MNDLHVDLSSSRALFIWRTLRNHLQEAHPKRVDVNCSAVLFLIDFRRDEVRSAYDRCGARLLQGCGETQVTDQNLTNAAVDEYVVALQIAVDDWIFESMKMLKALENLPAPRTHDLEFQWSTYATNVRQQRATRDALSDEANLVLFFVDPSVDESNDPGVLKRLEHADFLIDALPCTAIHVLERNDIPCNFLAGVSIETKVHRLVRTRAKLAVESYKTAQR